jgi:hypothetical protein
MAYDNTNTGVLFKNEDKQKEGANPNWPDYKGSINVEGTERWLSAWIKDGSKGKFMSLAIGDVKGAKKESAPKKTGNSFDDMQDDVPF